MHTSSTHNKSIGIALLFLLMFHTILLPIDSTASSRNIPQDLHFVERQSIHKQYSNTIIPIILDFNYQK